MSGHIFFVELCSTFFFAPHHFVFVPHHFVFAPHHISQSDHFIFVLRLIDRTELALSAMGYLLKGEEGPFVERAITKIEITTTQAVDVKQLKRDITASIGYDNIAMHGVEHCICDLPFLRKHGILQGCEVIIHILRPKECLPMEEPPPKRARCDLPLEEHCA